MCDSTLTLTNGEIVPCSKCVKCRARRVSAWSLRLTQEQKVSESSHFITLTYANEHLPRTPNGFTTINKRDLQLWFKRLRKEHTRLGVTKRIRYYACGEYGSNTKRPHYHLIMFDVLPEVVESTWGLGSIHIGSLTPASVGYTLKYISKGKTVPLHKRDDRNPEFSLMSKKLGKCYLTKAMINWHKADPVNRVFATIEDGKKVSLPRYFKDRIFDTTERENIKLHYAQKHADDYVEKHIDFSHDQYNQDKQSLKTIAEGKKRQTKFLNKQNDNL